MTVKLPAHRAGLFDRALGPEHVEGLPAKVISFHIVHLPACRQAGTPPTRRGTLRATESPLTHPTPQRLPASRQGERGG
jgi:hypothetical protein